MGIYIPSIKLPKDEPGAFRVIVVYVGADGKLRAECEGTNEAVPVPPHGRLIDAEKMRKSIRQQAGLLKLMGGELSDIAETLEKGFLQEIDNAPTIIPAEEGMA